MEPLTAGAMALGLYLGGKFADWGIEKTFDAGLDYAKQKLQAKSPDTIATLAALPAAGREDIGVAVLEIEKAAQTDSEIKAAVEALGNDVNQAAKTNPQLEKAIQDLTQMVQAQRPEIINENWQGINIKGGIVNIDKPNFDFRSK
jgi:hypothetical protein